MDSKAQLTADLIAKIAAGKVDIVNAAKLLNRSRRTIERYLVKYRKIAIQFVVHQNHGRSPANKTCDEVKRTVQALIKEKYFDVNLTHLGELLADNDNIQVKRETLRRWAHEIHQVKRAKRRRSQIRKRRERMESPGLLLQMDGSPHLGQAQVARQIKNVYKIDISPSGVRGIWLRAQMQTTALRLHKSNAMATV